MHVLHYLSNPALLGMLAVSASIVWMLANQKDKTRPLLVFAILINLFYGTLLSIVLGRESSLFPYKYDLILLNLDKALGVSAAAIAQALSPGPCGVVLGLVYRSLLPLMIICYFLQKTQKSRGLTLRSYVAELTIGPLCYAILPACGPIYAFGTDWLHPPLGAFHPVRLTGFPNAFPSLHVATAFVLVLAARKAGWRLLAVLFLLTTALATISTGEHFVIDLLGGLIFGAFAWSFGQRERHAAWFYLGIVCVWAIAIRSQYYALIGHPFWLRVSAGCSLLIALHAVMRSWCIEVELSEGFKRSQTLLLEDQA